MAQTRRNVWELGGEWADPILWYARGVAAMRARPLADPTSWRFYAGIHGFDQQLWRALGYFTSSDRLPSDALRRRFWAQCQHGSWYFLPWHRGYLLAFEQIIRAAVVKLGGPADWALPYWDYFRPGQNTLPPAFARPDWPDGGDNPLFVRPRFGPAGDGTVNVPLDKVNVRALNERAFTGVSNGGSPGFGGVDTGFAHSGRIPGGLESQPHNMVHVLVGGDDGSLPGAMSVPDSAGLDPIFWLHHANIDRLWESWNRSAPTHRDPTDAHWTGGPAGRGQRAFAMPKPDGTTWTFTPAEMTSLAALGYTYSDLTPAIVAAPPAERLERLGITAHTEGARRLPDDTGSEDTTVELVGASAGPVPIRGSDVRGHVRLDSGMRRKVTASLAPGLRAAGSPPAPDRVFLNLENIRGQSDTAAFDVYLGVPDDEDPTAFPDRLAGSVAPFGLRKASTPDQEHAGQGLTFVLEITDIVDRLHLGNSFDVDALPVRIVPINPVPDEAGVSIGRISVFRGGV
ncbi:tyrosinase family protein [Frankia sp. AiPa1]|uniref:tyrosinase family protein n=1 Tax=Frankia sp. AiPa1 TaxID=573492 RepID=UPI00202B6A34|nr:tyrosinase family protein [Frankia sp. AiPa1]MCL9759802.1 tyrosinase family protein [Frankia sp. AiPa1]